MQEAVYIDDVEQAMALLKPRRLEILRRLDEPRTCPDLAAIFDETPQKIYYHVKALEAAGLVEKVEERRVRGVVEGIYQARGRSYWLAPKLVGQIGTPKQARDQASLRVLMQLAEDVTEDAGRLGAASAVGQDVPSLSMSAHLHLPDGKRRADLMRELAATFQEIATKYGVGDGDGAPANFKIALMVYPNKEENA